MEENVNAGVICIAKVQTFYASVLPGHPVSQYDQAGCYPHTAYVLTVIHRDFIPVEN